MTAPSKPTQATRNAVLARDEHQCQEDIEYANRRISILNSGCWEWTGSVQENGYGRANRPGRFGQMAHRFVYELVLSPIDPDLTLDHLCHNADVSCLGGFGCRHRRCVNPDHLEAVTRAENVRRGLTPTAINLRKALCSNGHEFSHADRRGWRKCRICELNNARAKRRAAGIPEARRWASHCAHGHEWVEENTRWSKGKRYCKACDRERNSHARSNSSNTKRSAQ